MGVHDRISSLSPVHKALLDKLLAERRAAARAPAAPPPDRAGDRSGRRRRLAPLLRPGEALDPLAPRSRGHDLQPVHGDPAARRAGHSGALRGAFRDRPAAGRPAHHLPVPGRCARAARRALARSPRSRYRLHCAAARAARDRGPRPGARGRAAAVLAGARSARAVHPDPARRRRARLSGRDPPHPERPDHLPSLLARAFPSVRRSRHRTVPAAPRASHPVRRFRRLAERVAAGRGAGGRPRLVAGAAPGLPPGARPPGGPAAAGQGVAARPPPAGAPRSRPHPRRTRARTARKGDPVHDRRGALGGALPPPLGPGPAHPRHAQRQPQPVRARAAVRLLSDPASLSPST